MIKHALATIERGAVGNHALGINSALNEAGIQVKTYAETIRPEFTDTTATMNEFSAQLSDDDLVLYQFANPSPMADVLYERKCRLVINYHNITPASYFARWSPATAAAISRARSQLARLASVTTAAIAVSDYNASELVALGYRNVTVIPPVFSDAFYGAKNEEKGLNSNSQWLYVGRIAPHKNVHVLIHAFEIYLKNHDENAKLTIVGTTDTPLYGHAIEELIKERNLEQCISIVSGADLNDLIGIYKSSSVFVSASEHEGFCVPIIEAMTVGIPVVAVNTAAIGETSASASILVSEPDPELICEAVAKLEFDATKQAEMKERGFARSDKFDPRKSQQKYVQFISEWL